MIVEVEVYYTNIYGDLRSVCEEFDTMEDAEAFADSYPTMESAYYTVYQGSK